jgi:hypothetical protein
MSTISRNQMATQLGGINVLQRLLMSPLDKVDPMVLRIAMCLSERPNGPGGDTSWLQGIKRFDQLPRYDDTIIGGSAFTAYSYSRSETSGRLLWVIETLEGPWYWTPDTLRLEDNADAVHYRLMFS